MADEPPRRRRGEDPPAGREQPVPRRPATPRRASNERRREANVRRDQLRESRQRRSARSQPTRRRPRSELVSRVLIAIPAAVIAIVFVDLGGLPWAALMILLGWACVDELYRMLDRWKPATSVGLAAVAGMVLAARFGGQFQVLLILVAAVPAVFLVVIMRRERVNATVAIAGTLLGIYWIGLAFAHAVPLWPPRSPPRRRWRDCSAECWRPSSPFSSPAPSSPSG